jgi:endonuclease YncB( thermonuclease family)
VVRVNAAAAVIGVVAIALTCAAGALPAAPPTYRIGHVADGDTVDLANGQRMRLVEIDTPEVYFQPE